MFTVLVHLILVAMLGVVVEVVVGVDVDMYSEILRPEPGKWFPGSVFGVVLRDGSPIRASSNSGGVQAAKMRLMTS